MSGDRAAARAIKRVQTEYLALAGRYLADAGVPVASAGAVASATTTDSILAEATAAPSHVDEVLRSAAAEIQSFWTTRAAELRAALNATGGLAVTVREVDLPRVPRYLTHFDTVCVLDRAERANERVLTSWSPERATLIRATMLQWLAQVVALRDAISADVDRPLVVVYPGHVGFKDNEPARRQSEALTATYLGSGLGLGSLSSWDELGRTALRQRRLTIGDPQVRDEILQVMIPVLDPGTPLPVPGPRSTPARTVTVRELAQRVSRRELEPFDIGALMVCVQSAFFLSAALEADAIHLGADPVLDRLLWNATVVRNRVLSEHWAARSDASDEQLAAFAFSREFAWLDVSLDDAVRIREAGLLDGVRSILRLERERLKRATAADMPTLAAELDQRVVAAIREHRSELERNAAEHRRRLGLTALTFVAGAALGLATNLVPAVSGLSLPAALADVLVGTGPSLRELIGEGRRSRRRRQELLARPIAFLSDHAMLPGAT